MTFDGVGSAQTLWTTAGFANPPPNKEYLLSLRSEPLAFPKFGRWRNSAGCRTPDQGVSPRQ